jgi:hypothetical protein
MNDYEVAVLRILVKNRSGMKTSQIIDGFPDNSKDDVTLAISNLRELGFVFVDANSDYLVLNNAMKRDALNAVNPESTQKSDKPSRDKKELLWLPIAMAFIGLSVLTGTVIAFGSAPGGQQSFQPDTGPVLVKGLPVTGPQGFGFQMAGPIGSGQGLVIAYSSGDRLFITECNEPIDCNIPLIKSYPNPTLANIQQ